MYEIPKNYDLNQYDICYMPGIYFSMTILHVTMCVRYLCKRKWYLMADNMANIRCTICKIGFVVFLDIIQSSA